MKRIISVFFALVLVIMASFSVSSAVPYDSYTYSTQSGSTAAVSCPTPYYPAVSIDRSRLGVTLSSPCGMCFDNLGNLYIVDSGANQVLVLNPDYSLKAKIETFPGDNELTDFFSAPEGIFVADNLDLYICDTGNKRIVVMDSNYAVKRIYKDIIPVGSSMSAQEYTFQPTKLIVDSSGNMYVLVRNEYQGIVQLDSDGNFISFLGSNKVTYNPVVKLWKKIMSKQQKEQMEQFLPVEYSNLSFDSEGLILTVSKADETSPVKRLNLSGKDVLTRNGYTDVSGDFFPADTKDSSLFSDITGDADGNVFLLDSFKGRVFVYNSEGYLFYAFGGLGTQFGTFTMPSDIEISGTDILVCDSGNPRITVFRRTDYATLISEADSSYNYGDYETSIAKWKEVLNLNSNFELAYAQIGKVYLRQSRYEEAMRYFELGNCRGDTVTKTTGYNKAFSEYRREVAERWLAPTVIVVVVLVAAYELWKLRKKKKRGV